MKFSKRYVDGGREKHQSTQLPVDFWCPECDGMGLIPVVFVSRTGRPQRVSAVCHCVAGDKMNDGVRLGYHRAKELGLLDPNAKTKTAHWVHHIRVYMGMIGDDKTLEMIRHITESENPAQALREWWGKYPPSGPLASKVRI